MHQTMKRTFQSPFVQYKEYNGLKCRVLRRLNHETDNTDHEEVGELYRILLESGVIILAWPEEINGQY